MSNRVVCREASHAGSWYTASGRAPAARRRRLAPRPRPRSAALPRAAGGTGADRVGRERTGPASPPPPPGATPPGARLAALALTPEFGERESCPGRPPARAAPRDRARGRNVLPGLPDPSFPSPLGSRGHGVPAPQPRFLRPQPAPLRPPRRRSTPGSLRAHRSARRRGEEVSLRRPLRGSLPSAPGAPPSGTGRGVHVPTSPNPRGGRAGARARSALPGPVPSAGGSIAARRRGASGPLSLALFLSPGKGRPEGLPAPVAPAAPREQVLALPSALHEV